MISRLLRYLCVLRKNLWLETPKMQHLQQKRLRAIVKHAYENVPFYHRKFDEAKVRPDDVKSVSDLVRIPMTTKFEIQASSLEKATARNVNLNRCVKRTTSGSTGIPLMTVIDKRALDFEGAVWMRALLENGLRLRDKMAVINDPRHFPRKRTWPQRLGITNRKYISILDDAENQVSLLEEFKPDAIKSYPTSLDLLADICRYDKTVIKPRLVFTSAEQLDSTSRERISSTFDSEVFDNYACSEFSLLAWECGEQAGYHMNVDSVVMEFVSNGTPVAPDERGEIVCTSLVNYAMPLIRYRIADVGIPAKDPCSCGRTSSLMKIVEGRKDDFLVTANGRFISPTVFFPYPFEHFEGIKQFKVIQETRDRLTIQLAVKENFVNDTEALRKARRKVQKIFGQGVHVEFQFVDDVNRDPSGKLRKIVSRIPLNTASASSI